MKRKLKVLVILILSLTFLVSAGVVAAQNDVFQKYFGKNIDEIKTELSSLTTSQLISEIDAIGREFDYSNDLIPFAAELYNRKEDITDEEFLSIIRNDNNSIVLRDISTEVLLEKHRGEPLINELKEIIYEKDIHEAIKRKIIVLGNFTQEDVTLLKELVMNNDGVLAFHSLKALSKVDSEQALKLASNILNNAKDSANEKVSASLKVTAEYLNNLKIYSLSDSKLEKNFIELSTELINSNSELKDSALFAVSDIGSINGIKSILENENIEKQLKMFAVDQNFSLLKQLLLNNPNEDDIKLVIYAMEILPVTDMVEELDKLVVTDSKLDERRKKVIENIKENGIDANEKWEEE